MPFIFRYSIEPVGLMPHPDWSADYSYTPYENANHQSAIRPGNLNTWRENNQAVAYHRFVSPRLFQIFFSGIIHTDM